MDKSQLTHRPRWKSHLETVLLTSSATSSMIAVISQQYLLAVTAIPLTITLSVNLWNRREIETIINQHQDRLQTLNSYQIKANENLSSTLDTITQLKHLSTINQDQLQGLTQNFADFRENIQQLPLHQEKTEQLSLEISQFKHNIQADISNDYASVQDIDSLQSQLSIIRENNDKQTNEWRNLFKNLEQNFQTLKQVFEEKQDEWNKTIQKIDNEVFEIYTTYEDRYESLDSELASLKSKVTHDFTKLLHQIEQLEEASAKSNHLEQKINDLASKLQQESKKLENKLEKGGVKEEPLLTCEWCKRGKFLTHQAISFGNYYFCTYSCKEQYEKHLETGY